MPSGLHHPVKDIKKNIKKKKLGKRTKKTTQSLSRAGQLKKSKVDISERNRRQGVWTVKLYYPFWLVTTKRRNAGTFFCYKYLLKSL
jgi:hypothetical protein